MEYCVLIVEMKFVAQNVLDSLLIGVYAYARTVLLDNLSPVHIPLSESSLFLPKFLHKAFEVLSYLVAIVQIGGLLVVSFLSCSSTHF